MKLKSYFAPTVEAAMAMAARELGDGALLVYSREATPETRYLGRHEVVFAEGEASGAADRPPERPAAMPPRALADPPGLSERREMEERIGRLQSLIERQSARLDALLAHSATAPDTDAASIAGALAVTRLDGPEDLFASAADAAPWDPGIAASPAAEGVVLFAGPPGAGKTSLAVKLAGWRILAGHPAPLLAMLGEAKVGESHEIETYARLLGSGYCRIADPGAWRPPTGLAIIDTPGYCGLGGERETALAIEQLLARSPTAEVHLVLPASMRAPDLDRIVTRFRRFRPGRAALTRLDETSAPSLALAAAERAGLAVSFLSAGRRIPEDFALAGAREIAKLAAGDSLGEHAETTRLAARPMAAAAAHRAR